MRPEKEEWVIDGVTEEEHNMLEAIVVGVFFRLFKVEGETTTNEWLFAKILQLSVTSSGTEVIIQITEADSEDIQPSRWMFHIKDDTLVGTFTEKLD